MIESWAAFTIGAAALQAARTAAQRHVASRLSTDAGNFARFLYGWPVAAAYLSALALSGAALPAPTLKALLILAGGAVAQVLATRALILAVMGGNFGTGVAYSKTDVVQAAAAEWVLMGVRQSGGGLLGILIATLGVMLMATKQGAAFLRTLLTGWTQRAALWGLAAGTGYAISGVAYRAAALELGGAAIPSAAVALVIALTMQSLGMAAWLGFRAPRDLQRVLADWRVSGLAGLAGGMGSICWFSALALAPVAQVRTLGLSELGFGLLISVFFFRERPRAAEYAGAAVMAIGIAVLLNAG